MAINDFALGFVIGAHGEQKYGPDQPYVDHLLRVARKVPPDLYIPALLHDVVEDTPATLDLVARQFGGDVAEVVERLTHRKHESYQAYIARVSEDLEATQIKLADLADHIYHIEGPHRGLKWDQRLPRYQAAQHFLRRAWAG